MKLFPLRSEADLSDSREEGGPDLVLDHVLELVEEARHSLGRPRLPEERQDVQDRNLHASKISRQYIDTDQDK